MTAEELAEVLRAVNANRPHVTQTMNFNGSIGQQIAHVDKIEAHFDKDMGMQVVSDGVVTEPSVQPQEELFSHIDPTVIEESEQRRIHLTVKNLVTKFDLAQICERLNEMARNREIFVGKKEKLYDELVRMGMPTGDGFSLKSFLNKF